LRFAATATLNLYSKTAAISLSGQIYRQRAPGDWDDVVARVAADLRARAPVHARQFLGGAAGGTLSVTDGTRNADIVLLGNYLASAFVASSDGHGGTSISQNVATDHDPLVIVNTHA